MPATELTESLKAKLYDFTYTPFLSSFVIAWIVLNQKYLLVFFSEIDVDKKLKLLNIYSQDTIEHTQMYDSVLPFFIWLNTSSHFIWYPLGIALFYVFGYPYIANIFFRHTRKMKNRKKGIRIEEDGKEPIEDKERTRILIENYELQNEIDNLKIEMLNKEERLKKELKEEVKYETIIKDREIKELKESHEKNINEIMHNNQKSISNLIHENATQQQNHNEKIKQINIENEKKLREIEKKHKRNLSEKSDHESNNEEKKIATVLKDMYSSQSMLFSKDEIIDVIEEKLNYQTLKAEVMFEDILRMKYIDEALNIGGYYELSDYGKRTIIKYFDI